MNASLRPAWVEVDLAAIAHNTALMASIVAPARLCAVVKADAYGHGAVAVAPVVLAAGADRLAVALVEEGIELRESGVSAPILVLTEPAAEAMAPCVAYRLTPTLYSRAGIAAAAAAARGAATTLGVHLKVDTGMHRVGADLEEVGTLAGSIAEAPELRLEGVFSHLAVADVPDDPFTDVQIERFERACAVVRALGIDPGIVHLANSAGALGHPEARYDMVRSGIVLYGHLPAPDCAGALERALPPGEALRPAFSLRARVHHVRDLGAGERTSYGRRYALVRPSRIAVVPLGYYDGIARGLADRGAEVLIGGRRRPIAGTVTMDQIMVDCGEDLVEVGDEVVLVGRQGDEEITAEEWAEQLGTIAHEVFARIGPRVPTRYLPVD